MACHLLRGSATAASLRGGVQRAAVRPAPCGRLVVRASVSMKPENYQIPAAPDLVPEGPWKKVEGGVCAAKGIKASGGFASLRASGQKADLSLIVTDKDTAAAGVFTLNKMCAAPVLYCKEVLSRQSTTRAVLTNAGQANAATGDQGYQDALASANRLAEVLGVKPDDVLLMSTGVIGRRIKLEPLLAALPSLSASTGSSTADAHRAAVAITTTDLVSKEAALQIELDGKTVSVGGMCKGSGMIHPNMATMLGVVTTDAAVTPEVWRQMLKQGADLSFNQITVDGDTSTNDTIIGLATGDAGNAVITDISSPAGKALSAAVAGLLQGLAKSIAWDGEGATCLIEVKVAGAATDADARLIARTVCGSSLVKSAIFGHDPNWGRIAAAAGRAGVEFDQADVAVTLGDIPLMQKGQPLAFDAKTASTYLKETCAVHGTVYIKVSVGNGPGSGTAWGCDLSYKYVEINAEYTT